MGGTPSKDDNIGNDELMDYSSSEQMQDDSYPKYSLTVKESDHLSIDSLTSSSNYSVDSNAVPPALLALGYEFHEQIGSGTYSTVYRATNQRNLPNVQLACKMFRLNTIGRAWTKKYLKNEMTIMTKLRHQNLVSAYDVFKTRSKAFIFMKWAQNGSLDKYIAKQRHAGRASEGQTRVWYNGMMAGVRYLHRYNVAHRDLKLENFLLDDRLVPLLTDFSFAVVDDRARREDAYIMSKTICGTPLYLAPEVRTASPDCLYDAKKADIYSMGICLYEMLHGFLPFEGDYSINSTALILRQTSCDYKISKTLNISSNCKNLIDLMLKPKPAQRPTAKAVLAHAWLRTVQP